MKEKITKVQELVYELKVGDVMTQNVTTVSSGMPMSELREILRSHRISGTPVVESNKVVGIISLEDFIKWLAEGMKYCKISEKMTKKFIGLYSDEPLVNVLQRIERYGFGRFPVLDRKTQTLVGIITKGDIIEGLLKKLEIDYHEEEIHKYRASHIFEDVVADKTTLVFQYHIKGKDFDKGGEVASAIKRTLKRLGIYPDIVRRAAIAVYEAEINIIIYANNGDIVVKVEPVGIYIKAEDSGPGIPDIEKAMQPGFTTAPDWIREMGFGAGMGLTNIQKCSNEMILNSTVGVGTVLEICINMNNKQFKVNNT